MDYFELKKQRAKEQGKTWWYEAVLTDEEAELRTTSDVQHSCLWCTSWQDVKRTCRLAHNISDVRHQICNEWRYVA